MARPRPIEGYDMVCPQFLEGKGCPAWLYTQPGEDMGDGRLGPPNVFKLTKNGGLTKVRWQTKGKNPGLFTVNIMGPQGKGVVKVKQCSFTSLQMAYYSLAVNHALGPDAHKNYILTEDAETYPTSDGKRSYDHTTVGRYISKQACPLDASAPSAYLADGTASDHFPAPVTNPGTGERVGTQMLEVGKSYPLLHRGQVVPGGYSVKLAGPAKEGYDQRLACKFFNRHGAEQSPSKGCLAVYPYGNGVKTELRTSQLVAESCALVDPDYGFVDGVEYHGDHVDSNWGNNNAQNYALLEARLNLEKGGDGTSSLTGVMEPQPCDDKRYPGGAREIPSPVGGDDNGWLFFEDASIARKRTYKPGGPRYYGSVPAARHFVGAANPGYTVFNVSSQTLAFRRWLKSRAPHRWKALPKAVATNVLFYFLAHPDEVLAPDEQIDHIPDGWAVDELRYHGGDCYTRPNHVADLQKITIKENQKKRAGVKRKNLAR